ncbi:heterokaryon incompatibility protein-domain-containing protein [Pseudoneurospora amorphoporcata]|uniref:Heterokaryon incompatibility protein-domain-containing protein n=1 Tax=Pseudoneurospora amorphoporcata TaxID=241081 RepID=A0AAN6SEW7_9PEZI|nr:heterokaryon incompatibility protein-domain-containing protein [Pseudoneurospora amorphoporcata]
MWATADKETKYIQIYTPLGHPPAWAGISQGLELSPSPDSDEAFAFIKSQLQECDANHPKCKVTNAKPPTRLIDVQFSSPGYVRLVETASLPKAVEVPYIALSYCWGVSKTVTTVSSNYQIHTKQGFLVSSLPQTLQDAITVTRRLGQRYLWIDALCIIQDDLADWEVESAQMATVYRNAYLTIAAGTAASSDEGFLLGRRHAAGEPGNQVYQVPWKAQHEPEHGHGEDTCSETTTLAARILPYFAHSPMHPSSQQNLILPLDTRGWTLQERALSTRLLRFGTHELQWSCLSAPWACECGHKEYPPPSVFSLRPISTIQAWTSTTTTTEPDPADPHRDKETQIMHLWQNWDSIVTEYNARQLTQYLDRLPAVSGMAKVFAHLTGSRYVAGLWVDNFLRNLCWYLDKSEEDGQKGVVAVGEYYIAPSWSWASLGRRCSVKMHNEMLYPDARRFVPRAEVVEVEAVTVGKNPLGRVSDGWVRMRGVLKKGVLVVKEEMPKTPVETRYSVRFEGLKGVEVRVCPDTLLEEFEVVGENGEKVRSVRRAREGTNTKEDEKVSGSEVYLFLLGNFITINPRKVQSISLDFLVLGLSPRKGKRGVYERIGYGYTEPMFTVQIEDYVDLRGQELVTIV